jgi:outer membrane lipoprotein carrier protein
MTRAVAVIAALLTIWPLAPGAVAQGDLAADLQRRYDTIRDFSADFEHTYTGGILRRQLTERGRMLVKKPGKMRWDYTAPEKKTFVSDGRKLYSYLPADKQVIVTSVPQGDRATTPILFLAGQGNLTRDFTATEVPPPAPLTSGSRALQLVPKVPQAEFESLLLTVDARSLALKGLESTDAQGGRSSFIFINLKENPGLSDKEFTFVIPRGVDVVTDEAGGSGGGTSGR